MRSFRLVRGMPARLWTLTVERHTPGWTFRIDLGPCGQECPRWGCATRARSLPAGCHCGDQIGEGADRRVPLRISELSCACQFGKVVEDSAAGDW